MMVFSHFAEIPRHEPGALLRPLLKISHSSSLSLRSIPCCHCSSSSIADSNTYIISGTRAQENRASYHVCTLLLNVSLSHNSRRVIFSGAKIRIYLSVRPLLSRFAHSFRRSSTFPPHSFYISVIPYGSLNDALTAVSISQTDLIIVKCHLHPKRGGDGRGASSPLCQRPTRCPLRKFAPPRGHHC